ncbi:MAG: hypothetical protein ACLTYN_05890 [Dysosmobacter welbionis]
MRLFCSLPAVLGSRWTSCLAGWKRGETMRKLAAFTVSFALGICLAQYLLPERLLLPVAAVFFAAACLALLLPGLWRKRVLLVGTGLALALGWNWLYSYAVRAPLAALSGSEGTASMTLWSTPSPRTTAPR